MWGDPMSSQPTTEVPTDVLKRICAVVKEANMCPPHQSFCQTQDTYSRVYSVCDCDFGDLIEKISVEDLHFIEAVLRDDKRKAFDYTQAQDMYKKGEIMDNPIIKYFEYKHLPEHLQDVSALFGELAFKLDKDLPNSAEKSAGLRKLLEAKDCAVRAALESK